MAPWRVADPEPTIMVLLRRMLTLCDHFASRDADRLALIRDIQKIITQWNRHEDINELRDMLGIKEKHGGRRRQRTVDWEFAIAVAYAEHLARDTKAPREHVAKEFSCSVRDVDRAMQNWRHLAERIVRTAREWVPDAVMEYSVLKKRP